MTDLRPRLTLFDMTMIAIGGTIGSGIFLTPSIVAKSVETPWLILAAWTVGGLMALAGALSFAELASLMPQAGGQYVYLNKAYGPLVGFLFGWAYFLIVNTGGLGALSLAFATYLGYFIPLSPVATKLVAVTGLLLLTMINVFGVKAGAIFSDIFTVLKIAGILGLIAIGLALGSPHTTTYTWTLPSPAGGLGSALAVAMVGVFWSCGGWQHATYAAAEVQNPKRTIPVAMTIAALAVTAIYLAVNVAYLFLMTPAEIGASPRVAADAMTRAIGPVGGSLISLAIFISTFGVVGIYTLTAPRIYFAMANDGLFFKKVAEVHPRFQTPAFAILVQSAWAVVLILFWGTFENLISYVVFTDWIFFGLAGAAVFVFRRRMPGAQRLAPVPLYPLTPAFFVAVSVWFVAMTLIGKPAQAGAGLAFLALGIPVFYYWKRQAR